MLELCGEQGVVEMKVQPWIRGSRVAELAALMNTARAVRLFLERGGGVVLNELVLESWRIAVGYGRIGVYYIRICIVDHTKASGVTKSKICAVVLRAEDGGRGRNILHCDNNTSAANVETVRKLEFGVLSHPTCVQLPLEDMFRGHLLADSEEVEDTVHTWLRTGMKKLFADVFK